MNISNPAALRRVLGRTIEQCIPFVVHVELTHRCNLSCSHCYLPPPTPGLRELSRVEWKRAFGALKRAGTLFLVVSGGEPLLRDDAFDILEDGRSSGLALRILTNGTLVGEEEARRLAALHPSAVEISILGATARTHDGVTGSEGSFARACRALSLLADRGVRLFVKVPVLRANWREFHDIETWATGEGYGVRYDICIAQRLDGDETPLAQRLEIDELATFIEGLPQSTERDEKVFSPVPNDALACGAGQNAFSIAPDGTVHPCVAIRSPLGNIVTDSWETIKGNPSLQALRSLRFGDLEECATCDKAAVCGRCPGIALLETGRLDGPSPSACRLGEALKRILAS